VGLKGLFFTNTSKVFCSINGSYYSQIDIGISRVTGTKWWGVDSLAISATMTLTNQTVSSADFAIEMTVTNGTHEETISLSGSASSLLTNEIGFKNVASNTRAVTITEFYIVGNGLESNCGAGDKYATVIPRKPQAEYDVNILMDWRINKLANAKIKVYDYGSANDRYTCNYNYVRRTTEAEELDDLAEITHRGDPVNVDTLHGEVAPYFKPFGPHSSNVDPLINIVGYKNIEGMNPFSLIHGFSLAVTPAEVVTIETKETICAGGGFRFGSLLDTEMPIVRYKQDSYKVNSNRFGPDTYQNTNPKSAQHKICRLTWELCSNANAKNILIEVRGGQFTMNAGDNNMPFGVDEGTGDFTVRIYSPEITVSAYAGNQWGFTIEVIKC
jgi:hypothetical protein